MNPKQAHESALEAEKTRRIYGQHRDATRERNRELRKSRALGPLPSATTVLPFEALRSPRQPTDKTIKEISKAAEGPSTRRRPPRQSCRRKSGEPLKTTYSDKPWELPYAVTDDMWELQSPFHAEAARVTVAEFAAEGLHRRPGLLADVVQRRVWLAHNDLPWHPNQRGFRTRP